MNLSVNINDFLKLNEVKSSFQRIKIYEYIAENKNHPTVNTIFDELVKQIPTLSKMTVYNTLKLFREKNIIQEISIEDNELRYDANVKTHGHFKCRKCGEIFDFEYNNSEIVFTEINNYKIEETQLFIKGICSNCFTMNK